MGKLQKRSQNILVKMLKVLFHINLNNKYRRMSSEVFLVTAYVSRWYTSMPFGNICSD